MTIVCSLFVMNMIYRMLCLVEKDMEKTYLVRTSHIKAVECFWNEFYRLKVSDELTKFTDTSLSR